MALSEEQLDAIEARARELTGGPAEHWACDILNDVSDLLAEVRRLREMVKEK